MRAQTKYSTPASLDINFAMYVFRITIQNQHQNASTEYGVRCVLLLIIRPIASLDICDVRFENEYAKSSTNIE